MEVNSTLKEHIAGAKKGKPTSFNYLINSYWDFVHQYILKRTNDDFLAEEIVIQSFAKAFDKIDQYDKSYEFSTWIVQIAKNLHIDYTRKKELKTTQIERETNLNILGNHPSAEENFIAEQNIDALQKHVKELPKHYREIIELRYLYELPFNAISEQLNLPVNTLKVRALRAKKELYKQLK